MALWVKNFSVYGKQNLWRAAKRADIDIGREQPARIMSELGIQGATRAKKRFTTKSEPEAVRAPDLLHRDFTATRPNERWVSDFTYCSTWSGIV
jgi:putative transposase